MMVKKLISVGFVLGILMVVVALAGSFTNTIADVVSAGMVLTSLVLVSSTMIFALIMHSRQTTQNRPKMTTKQETLLDILFSIFYVLP